MNYLCLSLLLQTTRSMRNTGNLLIREGQPEIQMDASSIYGLDHVTTTTDKL